jgi:hypothetical protein
MNLAVITLAGLLLAQASPVSSEETRIDLYARDGHRVGYGIVNRGRIDLYDQRANRQGYGVIDQNSGRLDLFDSQSRRVGSGTVPTTTPDASRGSRR